MELTDVVRQLSLADDIDTLRPGWDASQRSRPAGDVTFLAPDFAAEVCRDLGLPEEVAQAASAACGRFAGNAALGALAWHYHHRLFLTAGEPDFDDICEWPSLREALGDDAGLFHLLVLLSALPRLRALNEAHGVPAAVARHTLSDLVHSVNHHRHHHHGSHAPGLSLHELAWFTHFLRGDLYRLGRLQFQFTTCRFPIRVFRHHASGTVLALSEEGVRYRANGQRPNHHRRGRQEKGWTAHFAIGEDQVVGHPILPTGAALPHTVSLPAAEWRQVLAPGDPVLHLHMPDGGPLAHDLCGESFRRAAEFFPRHFPERPFVGFCCTSWLLDAQLEDWLPPRSNMVRFQQEVYLVPVPSSERELLETVFDHHFPKDLSKAPRDTTLQRKILEHLKAGRKLEPRGGGCFLLAEDLDWGVQRYRRQPLDWLLAGAGAE
jgi:hypothetical protein